ncbi:hypothetical protein PF005_g1175 [Phytophthora fragariae]|uniref:Secreted protein n=1 Tax=Phytophthora fragariae TaxID=53985 RepID=A0A6A3FTK3_9STRA|nr:hypothetical protein PF003_g325 [Phytophthora fragariae]KAE8949515.1 hypothetical protein PF009_g943 [Phytophthora fragariae]KAE9030117.1 hypothetical protein PF011_g751 [Phytophthora fragariae]KAE9133169.1 hypothetical protein PF007_g3451 [Phytophthora fragariae]KAE9153030.1 hypothetical protein PF006_g2798 [Phytophthora fragariae]
MRHRLLLVAAVPVLHIVKFTERHNVDSVRSDARKVTCISGNTSSNSVYFRLKHQDRFRLPTRPLRILLHNPPL